MIWSQKTRDDWFLHYTFKAAIVIYQSQSGNLDHPTRNTSKTILVVYQSRSSALVFNSKLVVFMNNGLSLMNYYR